MPSRKILAAVDVAVERHRLDAELLAKATHREAGKTVVVDEVDRSLDDPIMGQATGSRLSWTAVLLGIVVGFADHRSPSFGHTVVTRPNWREVPDRTKHHILSTVSLSRAYAVRSNRLDDVGDSNSHARTVVVRVV
jgi:hypothetical protein